MFKRSLQVPEGCDLKDFLAGLHDLIPAGIVVGGKGRLTAVNIRLAGARPGYSPMREQKGDFNIDELTATFGDNGVHAHVAATIAEGEDVNGADRTIGGHLAERTITGSDVTIDVLDVSDSWRLTREFDEGTGYAELVAYKKK